MAGSRRAKPGSAHRRFRRDGLYTSSYGALAQLGERRLCKAEVTGSIPVRSIVSNGADSAENPRKSAELAIRRFATVRNGCYRFQPLFPGAAQGLGQMTGAVQGRESVPPEGPPQPITLTRRRQCLTHLAQGSSVGRAAGRVAPIRPSEASQPPLQWPLRRQALFPRCSSDPAPTGAGY
jgi:hypothetical protein